MKYKTTLNSTKLMQRTHLVPHDTLVDEVGIVVECRPTFEVPWRIVVDNTQCAIENCLGAHTLFHT